MGSFIGSCITVFLILWWIKSAMEKATAKREAKERQAKLMELKERERLIRQMEKEDEEEGDLFKEYDE